MSLIDYENALKINVQGNNFFYETWALEHRELTQDISNAFKTEIFSMSNPSWRYPVVTHSVTYTQQFLYVSSLNTNLPLTSDRLNSIIAINDDSGSNFLDYFPRFCPQLYAVKNYIHDLVALIPSGKTGFTIYNSVVPTVGATSISWALDENGRQTLGGFLDTLTDDDYILQNITSYTNKSDGTAQTKLGTWGKSTTSHNVYDTVTPMFFGSSSNPGVGYTYYLSAAITTQSLTANPNFYWAMYAFYKPLRVVALTYDGEKTPVAFIVFGSKSQWAKYFNSSGMPWAWNEAIVAAAGTNGLNMPTTPSQPKNPTDDNDGDGDNLSDTIEYPVVKFVPTPYSRYWISPSKLQSLRDFLFSDTFLNDIRRLWENPAENIIDCTYYPIDSENLELATTNDEKIIIGNVGSDVTARAFNASAPNYFFAGEYTLTNYYNSYLDFEPYTSLAIYLPYIGIKPLNTSKVTGHKIVVAYSFDFGNRLITAHIGIDGDMTLSGGNVGNFIDEYTSGFGVAFPLSGTANNQIAMNILNAVGTVATSAASIAGGVATANVKSIIGGVENLGNVLGDKIQGESYGSLSPTTGLYSPQCPYLIINRPIAAEPADYKNMNGYSAAYSGLVSEFSGFLQCSQIQIVSDGTMTDREQELIIQILQGGIYID